MYLQKWPTFIVFIYKSGQLKNKFMIGRQIKKNSEWTAIVFNKSGQHVFNKSGQHDF